MRPSYLHRLTLRQIEIFLAVSRLRSHSRAAEELALTQPAVSAQIRQLEQLTGEPLFNYLNKQLHITPAGQVMERAARDMQQRLISVEMELAQLKGAIQGTLDICIESSAQYFIPKLIAQFCQQHPGVQIRLNVDNRAGALKRLIENQQELVIIGAPPDDRSLQFTPIRENRLIIAAWHGHPLANQRKLSLHDVSQETFLIREPGSGTRLILEDIAREYSVKFCDTHQLHSNESILEGVKATLGTALLPLEFCYKDIEHKSLAALQVMDFPIRRSWCVAHRKNSALTPVGEKLKTLLVNLPKLAAA